MRVIAGLAKGHHLKAPRGLATRPMADKVKGSLFSVLLSLEINWGRILDLYAGSGSLGIEALSRGAEWVDFVEANAGTCRIIKENLEHTKFEAQGRVHCRPVTQFLASSKRGAVEKYDIILMDPPYADPSIPKTIAAIGSSGLAGEGTILVVGHSPRVSLADQYGRLTRIEHRRLGDSSYSIYIFKGDASSVSEDDG